MGTQTKKQIISWPTQEEWQGNQVAPAPPIGATCFVGLELSSVRSITCMMQLIPTPAGSFIVRPRFWLPVESLEQMHNQETCRQWVDQGHIIVTPGRSRNMAFILEDMGHLLCDSHVAAIAYDRFEIESAQKLSLPEKYPAAKIEEAGGGFFYKDMPTRAVAAAIKNQQIRQVDGERNPVLDWMFAAVALHSDPSNNVKINSLKKINSISGFEALVYAVGGKLADER